MTCTERRGEREKNVKQERGNVEHDGKIEARGNAKVSGSDHSRVINLEDSCTRQKRKANRWSACSAESVGQSQLHSSKCITGGPNRGSGQTEGCENW